MSIGNEYCCDCDFEGERDDAMKVLRAVCEYAKHSITNPNIKVVKIQKMIEEEYPDILEVQNDIPTDHI